MYILIVIIHSITPLRDFFIYNSIQYLIFVSTALPSYYAQETKYLPNNVLFITGPEQGSC
jgi:hypothetical protein